MKLSSNKPVAFPAIVTTRWQRRICIMAASALLASASAWAASTGWSGGGGSDISWANPANWTNGAPTATTDTYFTLDVPTGGAWSANNQVPANTTVQSLSYINTNGGHSTLIDAGVTLTISTATNAYALTGGGVIAQAGAAPRFGNAYIYGAGSLVMVASNSIMSSKFSQSTSSGSGSRYTLDLSGLDTLTGYLGRLYVAGDGGYRANGTMFLARTNLILLGYTSGPPLLLGNCSTGADGGKLYLGVTNAIFANNGLWVGYRRAAASSIEFNPSFSDCSAYFRNRAGTGRQSYWRIGDGSTQTYSGNAHNGTVNFSGGAVDALVDELVVGRSPSTAGAPSLPNGGSVGILSIAAGKVDVNTVLASIQLADYGPRVESYINVDGTGTLLVNNSMQLGSFKKANTSTGTSKALLNIGLNNMGGTVVVNGPITTATSDESDNWSEIVIRSGSLSAKNTIGPLNWLELTAGALNVTLDSVPTAPVCAVSNLITAAGFNLSVSGAGLGIGQYPIIKYWLPLAGGVGADDLVLSLPFYLEGYLSNNLANSSIDVVITNKLTLVWNGNLSDDWDLATLNWKDGTTGAAKKYSQTGVGDIVRFDNTATGSGTVNLTTDLFPFGLFIDNSLKAYTFTGTGRLTGTNALVKANSGTLTLANSGVNDYSGGTMIEGGTIAISSADRLPVSGSVTLSDVAGTSLDLNGNNQTLAGLNGGGTAGGNVSLGSGTLTVTGAGAYGGVISGAGSLVKSGSGNLALTAAQTFAGGTLIQTNSSITVANTTGSGLGSANVTIEEGGALYVGNGSSSGSVAAATITNNGSLEYNVTNDMTLANYIVGTGPVTKRGVNRLNIDTANDFSGVFWLSGGGIVRVSNPGAFGTASTPDSYFSMAIPNSAGASLELANNITLNEEIRFSCKSGTYLLQPSIHSVEGTNTLNGAITLTTGGSVHNFSAAAGSKLIVNGPIVRDETWLAGFPYYCLGGDGYGEMNAGLINGNTYDKMTNHLFKTGMGTWVLSGSNYYSGFTVISNGTLVVNGSILGTNTVPVNAAGFYLGCQVRAEGTLQGDGVIQCVVTNEGTIAPGSSVGSLTINNDLVNLPGSTNVFEISAAGFDQIDGLANVSYGGTLKVELSRSVTAGESFKLFSAASYPAANFDAFELPDISPLTWDTTQLTVDGTLRVAGAGSIEIGAFGLENDGNFGMSGSYGTSSAGYRVLATTNLADASSWIEVGSGTFASGAFSFTDLGSTNYQKRFYRVVTP